MSLHTHLYRYRQNNPDIFRKNMVGIKMPSHVAQTVFAKKINPFKRYLLVENVLASMLHSRTVVKSVCSGGF